VSCSVSFHSHPLLCTPGLSLYTAATPQNVAYSIRGRDVAQEAMRRDILGVQGRNRLPSWNEPARPATSCERRAANQETMTARQSIGGLPRGLHKQPAAGARQWGTLPCDLRAGRGLVGVDSRLFFFLFSFIVRSECSTPARVPVRHQTSAAGFFASDGRGGDGPTARRATGHAGLGDADGAAFCLAEFPEALGKLRAKYRVNVKQIQDHIGFN